MCSIVLYHAFPPNGRAIEVLCFGAEIDQEVWVPMAPGQGILSTHGTLGATRALSGRYQGVLLTTT